MNSKTKKQLIKIVILLAVLLLLGFSTSGYWSDNSLISDKATQDEEVGTGERQVESDEPETNNDEPETNNDDTEIDEDGSYTDKNNVALYIHVYGHLPNNYLTKSQAEKLGWNSKEGNLQDVAPGKSIGGSHFGNYDSALPNADGRQYKECDIDYEGGHRNAKRIIFSNDGLVFYTDDHYKTFEQIY